MTSSKSQNKLAYPLIMTGVNLQIPELSMQRIACWLHVDDADSSRVADLSVKLAASGVVHIAVSGVEASYLHDEIDDALLAAEFRILTTWHEDEIDEIAWEFLNVDFVSGGITMRQVIVFGASAEDECRRLSEISMSLSRSFSSEA